MTSAILRDVKGGLVASTAGIAYSIANGALIYSGALGPMVARGIGAGLLTTAVVCLILALTSGFRPVIGTANSATAAPLGAIMASLGPALHGLPEDAAVATVYALVAVTTLTTGAALLLLGSGRLGHVIRFIPHPVIAGFMGVSGALLVLQAVRLGTGVPVDWMNRSRFAQPDILAELCATAAFAGATALATRTRHPLALPALLVVTIVLVNAGVAALDFSAIDPRVQAIFLTSGTPMPAAVPVLFDPGAPIVWSLLWPHLPAVAAFALLVTLSALLVSIGLETALNVDVDFDRELRAQGVAVMASGLAGGFVGNSSVGSTMAGIASGARGRMTGVMAGLAAVACLLFGRPLLSFIPKFVIAGFLMEIGISVVVTWCVKTRQQMPFFDWLLVIGVVAVTIWVGLVPAILSGIVGGCILFALDLSRIDIVRRIYGLDERASPLVRPSDELAVLAARGAQAKIVELRGTLFFGSAYQILARVRQLLGRTPPTLVALDLTGVFGGDSSTVALLARLRRVLSDRGVAFAVAGGHPALLSLMRSAGALRPDDLAYPSREGALEAAEAFVLAQNPPSRVLSSFDDWLTEALGDETLARALLPHMTGAEHPRGAYLCRQGEETTALLFIETGRVAVVVGSAPLETVVRVFGPRTIAGEHGFVLQLPRTASLKVEEPARVWSLTRESFDSLSIERPDLVIALLRDIVKIQSERLAFATRQNAASG